MTGTHLYFHWRDSRRGAGFRSAVSLHSHTQHSQEGLDFLPRIVRTVPVVRELVTWQEGRYRERHGHAPDYSSAYWRPPFNEREALRLERAQIEDELSLDPLVSLTDHDSIDAGLRLRLFDDSRHTPVSLEWSVPFGPSFLHVGVHNLPPEEAPEWMQRLAAYTAAPSSPAGLLDALAAIPDVLIVLNHPLWDEKGIGAAAHAEMVRDFLGRFAGSIHALELNGLRGWAENQLVIEMAGSFGLPLLSGGDRHGAEPNANLNLTGAATFSEFVAEVRAGRSNILFMPQYRDPLRHRYAETVWDVLREYPEHPGRVRWTDRFFYRAENGEHRSFASAWGGGDGPGVIAVFMALLRFAGSEPVRSRLRAAFRAGDEVMP
jgi:hypothetical protein